MLLSFLATEAGAQTVDLAPAEDPSYAADASRQRTPFAELVSGCMGAFFERGIIVSDAKVSRIDRGAWTDPAFGLMAAREGYADFLLALYLTWKPAVASAYWSPARADYRLVRVSDGLVLEGGSVEAPREPTEAKAGLAAAALGAELARICAKSLGTRSTGGER
jgi:hypothetical protein